jgi:glycosyltransferase involved in cell wall biosynthesis
MPQSDRLETGTEGNDLQPRVLALIPAWNEALRIRPIIREAKKYLPVLVVDDGSTDNTAEVAENAGATVVRHRENRRKGAALQTGFDWALDRGYDAVLTLDADGQHDPTEIPDLLAAFAAGEGDLVIGNRDYNQMAWPRPITTRVGSWLLSLAMGVYIGDNQSGYRLISRRLLEQMEITTGGFEMEVEMIWEAVRLGLPIAWVPVSTIYGIDKASYFHPIKDTLRFLKTVWRIWRKRKTANEKMSK